ncbi:MAG: CHAD domain-containing protein [bacterium]|nr:CHAD domain-containing protein [bacterium]
MPYRIKRKESVQAATRRIATEQIDKALREIDEAAQDRNHAIHQVRKRCKKLRGLLRLVRPALGKTYQKENKAIRDAARRISDLRDAQTTVDSHDRLMTRFDKKIDRNAFASTRLRLAGNVQKIPNQRIDRELAKVRSELSDVQRRVRKWKLDEKEYDAVRKGMIKTRKRAEKMLQEVMRDPTTKSLHEFRKRVKYHGYHLRLLRNVWSDALHPMERWSSDLGELLGEDHDLAVYRQSVLDRSKKEVKVSKNKVSKRHQRVLGKLVDHRRETLQSSSLTLGRKFFAESTDSFSDRIGAYWSLWREDSNSNSR